MPTPLNPSDRSNATEVSHFAQTGDLFAGLAALPMTMSSIEIAELVEKEHKNVVRDIRAMLDGLKIEPVEFEATYVDAKGESRPCFHLRRRECLILVSGYKLQLRARIIDRWEELERQIAFGAAPAPAARRAKADRPVSSIEVRRTHAYWTEIAERHGLDTNSAFFSANRMTRRLTGVDVAAEMGITALPAPGNETSHPPTFFAAEIGVAKHSVNVLLTRYGFQTKHRDGENRLHYRLTEKGAAAGGRTIDSTKRGSDGRMISQVIWPPSIVDRLRAELSAGS